MVANIQIIRLQSINCLVRVSFTLKNEVYRRAETKKFGFFEKSFQPPLYHHQMKVEEFVFSCYFYAYLFVLPVFIICVCIDIYMCKYLIMHR